MTTISGFVLAALSVCFPLLSDAQPRVKGPMPATILKNVNMVDVEQKQVVPGMDIVIESGVISRIGRGILPDPARRDSVVDLTGKYVIPGLIDAHTHISNGIGLPRAHSAEMIRTMVRSGITSVRDMGGDARVLAELKRAVAIGELEGPDLYYAAFLATDDYYDGRGDRMMTSGMQDSLAAWAQCVEPGADLDAVMIAAKATGATGVKIYLGYQKGYLKELVAAARKHDLQPWAHAMLFPAKPSEVAAAGATVISHAYMFEWENLDSLGHGIQDAYAQKDKIDYKNINLDQYIAIARANNTILDATVLISLENGMNYAVDITRKVYRAGLKVAAGTDWFMTSEDEFPPLYREIGYLVDRCGFSNIDALRSATIIAAETFQGQDRKGSIAAGKDADLVILTADPTVDIHNLKKIDFVLKGGKRVGDRKAD